MVAASSVGRQERADLKAGSSDNDEFRERFRSLPDPEISALRRVPDPPRGTCEDRMVLLLTAPPID